RQAGGRRDRDRGGGGLRRETFPPCRTRLGRPGFVGRGQRASGTTRLAHRAVAAASVVVSACARQGGWRAEESLTPPSRLSRSRHRQVAVGRQRAPAARRPV